MTEDLLERVRREIRERKQVMQGAVDESRVLERVLVALTPEASAGSSAAAAASGRPQRSAGPGRRAAPAANRDAIPARVREQPGATGAPAGEQDVADEPVEQLPSRDRDAPPSWWGSHAPPPRPTES